MTLEELRGALKVIDRELMALQINHPDVELRALGDGMADLSEYFLKAHARIERLSAEVSRLTQRMDNRAGA